MKVQRVEQHFIKKNNKHFNFIDDYCFLSKNLYNYANFIIRKEFINNDKWIRYNDLFNLCKNSTDYKNLGSNTGQATLRLLDKNWNSFFISIRDWKENPGKYLGRPKIPKYLNKNGRYPLLLDNNKVGIKDGKIYFKWKKFKIMNNIFSTKIPTSARVIQCRFVPRGSDYIMEIVYEIEVPDCCEESKRIVGIDLGMYNFITMSNNIGEKPIVIKGGVIKSINQYYNRKKARIQSELMMSNKKHWSNRLQKLTNKRYEKIKYQMHCISKYVVDYCVLHNIDTLVIGHSKKWKQENKRQQGFSYIPYEIFIKMLAYKCENNGIKYIEVEEQYTSGTSFLDDELPAKENYNSVRRIYRGLFVSNEGTKINADVNAAYQIIKKVFPDAFSKGIEGVGLHPTIVKLTA